MVYKVRNQPKQELTEVVAILQLPKQVKPAQAIEPY
jgi:hypothetical protein